ncbi:MAG: 2-hydroxy-3-oxopropionate reductase [Actinomyces sp.]|nr:2-hydroxy-3-oxopropionate reductase [Actinomyces sp.]MDO4899959.1 2-hydroxy-3-oxopropionate reductase [Actinomyces sp.]
MIMRIGFIGLGIMGKPMAINLVHADYELVVFNRSPQAVAALVAEGARAANSPQQVAEQADVVLTMLPKGPDVLSVVEGERGLLAGAHAGLTLIDMSSIAPGVSQQIGGLLEEQGVGMLDAPVSGGEPGAIDGTLAFMVGGPQDLFDRYRDVLGVMGSSVTRVGELGAGNTAKLANQVIVAVNIAALSEALVLAHQAGVDPRGVVDAIRGGLAGSKVLEQKAEKMLTDEFAPGFRIDLHTKDLNNALETAHSVGAALPLAAAVREMMTAISNDGHLRDDHSSLLAYYERLAGTALADLAE